MRFGIIVVYYIDWMLREGFEEVERKFLSDIVLGCHGYTIGIRMVEVDVYFH